MKTKTRISTTVTNFYVECMNKLVEEGIYLNSGQIIRETLRHLFRSYGLVPSLKEAEG